MAQKRRYCYDYPRPMVAVDCALFRLGGEHIEILMIRRGKAPYKGAWALPGGFIGMNEPLDAAVVREVVEETGIRDIPFLIQLGAYGDPGRDPRGRVIAVAYAGIVSSKSGAPQPGDDAAEAAWFPIEALPERICFDHPAVIGDALRRFGTLGRTSGSLFVFLDDKFTLPELNTLLKALYGIELDPQEYIESFLEMGLVREARAGGRYRFVGGGSGRRRPRAKKKGK